MAPRSPAASRSAARAATTGLPASRAATPRPSRSGAARGDRLRRLRRRSRRPPPRPARARTSTSSIARSHASSETASCTASGTKIGVKSPLDVKKCGLALALEVDVEPQVVRDQRVAHRGILDRRQQRVGCVGRLLVREVDPREEVLQQPTGENDDVDVRRVRRGGARLDGVEAELAVLVGRRSGRSRRSRPPAAAPRACPRDAGSGRARFACQISTSASTTGSPAPS